MPESPHRVSRGRVLAEGEEEGIVGAWNVALEGVPLMHRWTVEQLMARVNKVEGIDLGWRTYLRERYDV